MNFKVRLVQQLDKPGWRNMRDVLDLLPGPSFEDTQQVAAEARPRSQGGPKVPSWTYHPNNQVLTFCIEMVP